MLPLGSGCGIVSFSPVAGQSAAGAYLRPPSTVIGLRGVQTFETQLSLGAQPRRTRGRTHEGSSRPALLARAGAKPGSIVSCRLSMGTYRYSGPFFASLMTVGSASSNRRSGASKLSRRHRTLHFYVVCVTFASVPHANRDPENRNARWRRRDPSESKSLDVHTNMCYGHNLSALHAFPDVMQHTE